jgi:hypothetical protein
MPAMPASTGSGDVIAGQDTNCRQASVSFMPAHACLSKRETLRRQAWISPMLALPSVIETRPRWRGDGPLQ